MLNITCCPTCGSDKIKKVRRTWVGESGGETYKVPSLVYHECPACGEKVLSPEAIGRIEAISPALSRVHAAK